jgi:hypothetical protein
VPITTPNDLTRGWLDEPQHLRRSTAVRCAALHRRLRAADRRPPPPTWASPTTRLQFQVNKKGQASKLPSFQASKLPRPFGREIYAEAGAEGISRRSG